jgi:hypothetical protein
MKRVPLFLLTICKESAISPTDIMNMRIRSSKVPIVAPMMGVATLIVQASGWAGAEADKFEAGFRRAIHKTRGGRKAVRRLED